MALLQCMSMGLGRMTVTMTVIMVSRRMDMVILIPISTINKDMDTLSQDMDTIHCTEQLLIMA